MRKKTTHTSPSHQKRYFFDGLKGLLHNSPEKKTELSTTGRVEESSVLL